MLSEAKTGETKDTRIRTIKIVRGYFVIFPSNYHEKTRSMRTNANLSRTTALITVTNAAFQYFTNWIEKSFSFIPISKYFSVKCLKS